LRDAEPLDHAFGKSADFARARCAETESIELSRTSLSILVLQAFPKAPRKIAAHVPPF